MKKMYCLVVTDDYSRIRRVFFLATKDETSGILKSFITRVENLMGQRVKVIRYDNGSEFKNTEMNQFCERKGIKREFSVARTPQQNGVAERKNRTLIKAARTMLADFKLSTTFWAEAVNIACYVQNRSADLPFSQSSKSSPDAGFKPLGDDEKKVTEELGKEGGNPSKEDERDDQEKDASVNGTNNVNDASINEVNDVDVDEDVGAEADMKKLDVFMPVSPIPTTRVHKDHQVEQIIGDLNSAPQTRRMTKNLEEHGLFSSVQQRTNHKDFQNCLFACFLSQEEPKKVIHALKDPSWIEAMQDELLQFKLQKVWTLVDLPNGKRPIGTKWVFRNKKDERGIVIKNKARLVAQGYTQEEGIDYDEVFAPVARIEAIRLFLAYASFKDFMVYQMDIKSAFLYGRIEEEFYVCQRPKFEDLDFPDRVYKVENVLYGLHQAPRAWYETLSTYLLDNGFQRGKIDKTLFIRSDKGDILLVQVYVDDITFCSTKKSLCTEFEKMMHKKFQMSFMGELTFFFGLQVKQNEDRIFISQDKYVTEILKKFGFTDIKTASTPMETQKLLLKDEDGKEVDVHLYRSMIGSLMYLTCSRPDIMFEVCAYSPFDLVAYTDSDYAGASLDRKSITRGCQFFGSKLISWQCKKQTVVANSTIEAEYVDASSCCGQVLWIQNQLLDYGHNLLLLLKVNAARHNLLLLLKVNAARHNLLLLLKVNAARHNLLLLLKVNAARHKLTTSVENEAVYEEMDDSLERVATTATSLDAAHDRGNITKTQSKETLNEPSSFRTSLGSGLRRQETMRDTIAQTGFENVSKTFNDSLLAGVNIPRSDEHKKKRGSRTHKLKRLYKVGRSARIISSDEASLGDQEDASKQERKINDIDKDTEFTLVDETQGRYGDDLIFNTSDLASEEVFVVEQGVPDSKKDDVVSTICVATTVSTAVTTILITSEEITLAQAIEELKTAKPKVKRIVFKEPVESITTTTTTHSSQQPSQVKVQDKGKGKMVEPEKPMKKKELIRIDEKITSKLQAEFDKEVRLAREKAKKE
ncbi:putative ribonuclease H-like domain-containing protein [Tanacetum coccineum]